MTNANNCNENTGNIYKTLLNQGAIAALTALNEAVERHSRNTEKQAKAKSKRRFLTMVYLTDENPNTPSPTPFSGRIVTYTDEMRYLKPRRGPPKQFTSRQELLAFVRIVFANLEDSAPAYDNMLRERAKAIVFDCVRRHRLGHAQYRDLQYAVVRDLRPVVGEAHWADAKSYLRSYCHRRAIRPSPISVL